MKSVSSSAGRSSSDYSESPLRLEDSFEESLECGKQCFAKKCFESFDFEGEVRYKSPEDNAEQASRPHQLKLADEMSSNQNGSKNEAES